MSHSAFVTGGTGFVGANLVARLTRDGWDVTALHRPTSALDVLERFPARLVCGDLIDHASLLTAIPQGVDVIFHVASDLNFQTEKNAAQTATNVDGTRHLVDAAIARGASRFVYLSTLATYGVYDAIVTEATRQTAANSSLNYARTKWQAEEVVRAAANRGLHTTILNPGGILGPLDRSTWGLFFFLVRDGLIPYVPDTGIMTWSHVADVVAALIAAARVGRSGENYILGGAEADLYTVLGLMAERLHVAFTTRRLPADLLRQYTDAQAAIAAHFDEPTVYTPEVMDVFAASYRCNDTRAREELACTSRPLEQMIADAHAWLVDEGLL